MKRSPIRRKTGLRARRKASNDWSPAVRRAVEGRSYGWCEAVIPDCCTGNVEHIHHKLPRRFGDHTLANALGTCSACHQWIHEHPAASYEAGWLIKGNGEHAA